MRETDDTRRAIPSTVTRQDMMTDTPASTPDSTTPDTSPAILQVDAARRAGVSVRTIQRAIDRGNLPATRDGKHCWIRLDDLEHWQVQRTTRSATSRVVARDNDASYDATLDMPDDASWRDRPQVEQVDLELSRLQREIADLRLERDRWHQAFERESALREEETRQLQHLLRQEQALSFSRLAAIEATTRHVASPAAEDVAVIAEPSTPPADTLPPPWRRWWRRMTGGG